MEEDRQQRVHFLVALLQCPAGAVAQLVSDSTSAVSTTLSRLIANTLDEHNDSLRPLLHAVTARLVSHPKSNIPLPLLALYSHAFLNSNYHLVTLETIPEAFASSPKLAQDIRATSGPALIEALANRDSDPLQPQIVLSLIRATCHAGPLGPIVPQLVQILSEVYPSLAVGDELHTRRLRLAVLETAHDLVQVVASGGSGAGGTTVPAASTVEALEPVLAHLLNLDTTNTSDSNLLARDLVSWYEPLGAALADAVQGAVGPVARNVKDQIARLRRLSAATAPDGHWFADLRSDALGGAADPAVGIAHERDEPITTVASVGQVEDRIESRAPEGAVATQVLSQADNEADLAQAVASLLDLFPSESPQFLRACLVDPTFASTDSSGTSSSSSEAADVKLQRTTERVVEGLLGEAQLPDRLLRIRLGQDGGDDAASAGVEQVESTTTTTTTTVGAIERRNVYDDDKYFQRGTLLGPAASRARSTNATSRTTTGGTGRIQLDERLKASIIALAERESSDEDDDDESGRKERYHDDGFGEEEEDGGAGTATPRIKIGAADEEPDENEQEGERGAAGRGQQQHQSRDPSASSPCDPSTVLLLEQAYLRSPAVFARDSATRRGKARKDLRDRTKLGDEQIEGWKIMLEREPRKLQKLQDKHTDLAARANRPDPVDPTTSSRNASPARTSNDRQQAPHLGGSRGGASTGRGGGRGGSQGGGGANGHGQGQQQKRSDGGRREHDRAKRGRDRKMARMGAGPPPA